MKNRHGDLAFEFALKHGLFAIVPGKFVKDFRKAASFFTNLNHGKHKEGKQVGMLIKAFFKGIAI